MADNFNNPNSQFLQPPMDDINSMMSVDESRNYMINRYMNEQPNFNQLANQYRQQEADARRASQEQPTIYAHQPTYLPGQMTPSRHASEVPYGGDFLAYRKAADDTGATSDPCTPINKRQIDTQNANRSLQDLNKAMQPPNTTLPAVTPGNNNNSNHSIQIT